ncbi:uncharacterized protein LOC106166509 [Lingula anatina]|uniref:Uncharacterized protein LOC106166509 n=1 Tax=Lingula anatina TaxID=7574 RepID=A0A1S3IQQ7_LINAN|nr:uncharacterized protein LOC106166509 [Lingula anatina]|eukprot:XP_013400547.1 uncharacterized protein LOC106166509 [Lingula anatina]
MPANLTHNSTYYTTLTALNHGLNPKSINRTSDGILIDLTTPVAGWAVDGLNLNQNIDFSAETATVSSAWDGFYDPESGIDHYEVIVIVNNEEVDFATLKKDQHFEEHTFSLEHGDTVKTIVRGKNGAGQMSAVTTDGYFVDLTPPVLNFISQSEEGLLYQSSDSYIYARWQYDDQESGILEYRVTVFQSYHGQKQRFWPYDQRDKSYTMEDGEKQFIFNKSSLKLDNGAKYSLHVTAINRALLSANYETKGVTVDTTPPVIKDVHVGLFEEEEELDELNRVLHVDSNGIEVSWVGHDGESGIVKYMVGIGVNPGDVSVTGTFIDFGSTRHGYVKARLNATASSGYTYYVTVIAFNGAGLESHPKSSRPIFVLKDNVPGIVFDGRQFLQDANSQRDTSSIACSFVGFESEACGITAYEWAIGSEPGFSDIRDYSSIGIVMANESAGFAQTNLDLPDGQTIYTAVRARTGHKCHEDFIVSVSDGIVTDASAPDISFQQIVEGIPQVPRRVLYTASSEKIVPMWNFSDTGSGVAGVTWTAGTLPGLSDRVPVTYAMTTGVSTGAITVNHGETIFVSLTATDNAGNQQIVTSPAVLIDTTPPVIQNFRCTDILSPLQTTIYCNWTPIDDTESDLKRVQIAVGLDYFKDDLAQFSDLGIYKSNWMFVLDSSNVVYNLTRVFVTLKTENVVNLTSVSVAKIILDSTPPLTGYVHITTSSAPKDTVASHPKCQVSETYVDVLWDQFLDPESGIERYEVAVGSYFQGTDIIGFKDVGLRTSTFIDGLALPSGGTVYASVRGFNKGGLYAIAVSAGVVVSPHPHLTVMDGNGNIDIDFQTELTTVLAQWDYQDPCPLQEVLWSVVRVDGVVIKPPSLVPSSDQFLIIDGVDLENDKTYYSVVTVVDAINRTQTARSDGFTVNIEPPFPGYVADGLGEDINYQRSTTKLSANWGSFGDLSSNDPSQIIEHYEVAVGNDRRYSLSRANVHGFVNVGIATNHTFNGLNLTAKSITYYVTVRAYSEAGSMAEASSNGIKVGFEAFIKPGFVFSKSSQSSTEELHAYWEGFSSDLPILDYQVGVSSNANFVASLSNNTIVCENVYSQDGATFDVTMKSVGVDMSVKLSDLSLRHGTMYFVVVKATDAAGNCGIATSPPILIDTTPPLPGKIVVGLKGTDAMYTVSTETLIATWPGFRDTETHIAMYEVSLFQRSTCSSKHLNKSELALMQGPVEVKNDTSIEFTRVQLLPRVPYYIKLTAYNEARLQITQWSDPVFVDETPPFPGDVKHGSDWKTSSLYQASTTTLQGMIGIAHDAATALCPSSKRIHFTNLVPNGMHALKTSPQTSDSPQTYYQTANVQTKSDQLVLITGHDEYSFHLELAGVKSELSPDVLGNFSFFLQAAEGETIITSVTLSKGDNDEIFAFEEPVIVNPPSSEMFQNASIEFHSDSSQPDMNNGTEKNITEIHQNTNASVLSNITTNGLKFTDQNVTDKNNSAEIRTNNHKAIFSNITVNVSEHVVNNKTDKNNSTDLSSNNDTVNYNITSNGLDHVVNNEADKKNSTELSFNNNTIYYNITSEGSEQAVNNGTDKNNTKEIHPNNKNAIHLDITSNRSENTSGNGTDIINSSEIHENTEIALQRNITNNGSNVISQVSYAPGIGLHIVGHAYGAKKKWFCLFWCTNEEGRKSEWVELPFDPTTKAATYTIQIEKEEYPTRTSWSAKLHINSGLKAVLYNIIKPNGYLKIRTWSINDFVPEVPDAFHPFKTQATLNYFEIPRPTNKPCHLGRTFYDFESKLNALWVGVGSSDNLVADVIPLHLYKHFCSPCQYQCDMTCSTDCPHSSFELTEIRLNNLTLDSKRRYVKDVMNTDSDKPNAATYFMIIKTVNHAGLGTTVSSKGITIDTTPPRCTLIQCLDPSYSMEEPVEYAGTNESIGAYWDCEEDVSDIITYDVAVGTHHGQQDIIPFHSVGLKDKLVLSNFTQPLQQLHTYYISVRANNAAGQSTIVTCHVTIDSKQPDVAGIKETVKPPGVTQLPDMPDVYLTINQHGAGLEWARGSDTLAFYEWQIGSADGDSDIFPLSKIGVTNSTKIAISDGKLVMDNVDASMSISAMANHSASDKSTEDLRQESFFSMEPGRCLYQSLIATSKAHKSSSVANITSCIKRPKDSLSVLNQERVNLVLSKEVSVTKETSDNALQLGSNNQAVAEGDVNVYVKGENGGVLAGLLSVDDVQVHYGSAASSTFSSYIQDPVNTNNEVSRTLFKRFRGTTDTSFFVSPVGHAVLTDNLEVEASFKPDSVQQGLEPVLIYWNTETRRWHQVNEDCDIDQRVSYSKNTISARVCSLNQPGRTARRKRSTGTEIAPTQFAVVIMSPGIENNPPKLVTTELYLMEDQKDFQKQLEFSDSENDQVYFEVVRPPRHGYANISAEGLLMYIPEKDFNGLDTVTVKMKEVPPSVKNFRPYVVTSEVKLHVNATNDPAVVSFLNLGHNSATQFLVSTTYNIAVEGKTDLKHVGDLILTDPDKNEQLQFIINHPMAENYTLVMQDINKNAPEEQVFQTLGTLGSVKVRKVYINSSRHFHGEVAFNVTGKDGRKRSPYAPLVSFHIFVLANPCEYGQCVGLGQDANCTSFDRASSFDGYECVCDAGYSGERCETEMEKGTKCRCPTFYDCIDEEDHYYCVLSPWKLPVTCVFLLLAAVLLLAGGYRLSKKWTSKVKVIPVRENPTADTIELNEVMRWQDETDKSISPVETNTDMPSQLQEPDRHAVYIVPGEVQDLETEEEPEEDQDNTDNCSTALGPSEDAQTENGVLQSFEPTATLSGVEPKDEIRTSGMAMLTSLMAPVGAIPRPELKMIHVKPAPKPGPKQPKERFSRFDLRPKRKQKNESTA